MSLRVVPGTANPKLALGIATFCGLELVECEVERFPDGEIRTKVQSVAGDDVFVVQPTGPPVNEHLAELAMLIDACRRGRADRVTAVIPYFGYARQDRRSQPGESLGVRVALDFVASAGADRLIVVDSHTPALEATSSRPVEMLSAAPFICELIKTTSREDAVLVAPDLGAVKLAERYARTLSLPVAVIRKQRLSGATVRASDVVGDVGGTAIVVDDMISTGATIEAAVRLLRESGTEHVVVAATHLLPGHTAIERLRELGIDRLVTTDSLLQVPQADITLDICPLQALLGEVITRLHTNAPLDDLVGHR